MRRVDSEAWARAEMAKAAADPIAFERRLKEQLEQRVAGRKRFEARDNDGVWVEEIRLEGSYPDTTGVIILRDDRQPGCRFAWSFGHLWDWRDFENAGGAKPEITPGGSRCTWMRTWRPSTTGSRSAASRTTSLLLACTRPH
jgi:hypothetical protein